MAHSRAFWRFALASFCLWMAAPVAYGAKLGPLTLRSYLGQPLNAEIEILSLQPGEEKGLAARLPPRAAFRKAGIEYGPALAGMRVSIERVDGRRLIRLRTSRPIAEPILQILIELHWKTGRLLSTYTAFLDPPGYKGAPTIAQAPSAAPRSAGPANASEPVPPQTTPEPPLSRNELFGLSKTQTPGKRQAKPVEWHGYVENYTAYDYTDPKHWSRGVVRTQIGTEGGASGLGSGLKWKITARLDVDPVYAESDFYPPEVRKDQRADFALRETYLDTSAGNFDLRLGKQNIVWGEMVGLFFADVVSARDLRDFILPDFETIRIPQWAARAEYFGEKSHFEVVWLPYPSVDDIGKPGAEFYPFQVPPPPGFNQRFNNEVGPERGLRKSNYGVRASTLQNGWDLSAFYYRSTDVNPTFYREVTLSPTPTLTYTPRHDRIWQAGGTLAKAFESVVAKAEVVYASGRSYNVTRLTDPTGVVPQDTVDYVLGLDFTLPAETRLNVQYFERDFFKHDPDLLYDRREGGVTLLLSGRAGAKVRPELFIVQSVNRRDRMVRASLSVVPATNWLLTSGVVTFTGPPTGFFGRFDHDDRIYFDLRRDF